MPKRKNQKGKGYKGKAADRPEDGEIPEGGVWRERITEEDKTNEKLFEYYATLLKLEGDELEQWKGALRRQLPTTFRIAGPFKDEVAEYMQKNFFNQLTEPFQVEIEGEQIEVLPPRKLDWYPEGLAWQVDVGRRVLKRSEVLQGLRNFMITHTGSGQITRQEAVSMIPALFLDVQPQHLVLDLCAAPGSKTSQLLEVIQSERPLDSQGLVIANDLEFKRCSVLAHQTQRVGTSALLITSHQAQGFPSMQLYGGALLYDRILADVPCAGDGTIRKNLELWKNWSSMSGGNLHKVQVQILSRAIQLIKPAGRIVYSTCSMNPLEDEAVIATVLTDTRFHDVELVDCSASLSTLKRATGLHTWQVKENRGGLSGIWYDSFDAIPTDSQHRFERSFFPPAKDVAQRIQLERCMRFLPHFQDTGGFFVAVLQRKPVQPSTTDGSLAESSVGDDASGERPYKKMKVQVINDSLRSFTPSEASIVEQITEFFGLSPLFPTAQLMTNSDQAKTVYFVAKAAHELLTTSAHDVLTVFQGGTKLLVKIEMKGCACPYRVLQNAAALLLPYITKRHVRMDSTNFGMLLARRSIKTWEFSLKPLREQVHALEVGSLIVELEHAALVGRKAVAVACIKNAEGIEKTVTKEELSEICSLLRVLAPSCVPVPRDVTTKPMMLAQEAETADAMPDAAEPQESSNARPKDVEQT